jgi:hypothetical protein
MESHRRFVMSRKRKSQQSGMTFTNSNAKNCEMRMPVGRQAWTSYGGLGPDLNRDEVCQRLYVNQKVKDFSESLRLRNRERILSENSRPRQPDFPKTPTNRERAMDFAKTIQKPCKPISRYTPRAITSLALIADTDADKLRTLLSRFHELTSTVEAIRSKYSTQP